MSAGRGSTAPEGEALLRRLDAIEVDRDRLIADLESTDPARRSTRPAPEVWSPEEIVEHMVLAERWVMRGLFDAEYMVPRRRSLKNRIMMRVVLWILRSPIGVRVPARGMEPTGGVPLADLVPMWRENHDRLRTFLSEADAEVLATNIFYHPVSGPIPPRESMGMLEAHFARHAGQIRERLRG